jgi:hypothetical protein
MEQIRAGIANAFSSRMATTTTRIGGVPSSGVEPARYAASIVSGLIASQIGAIVMAIFMFAVYPTVFGTRLFYPLDVIGSYLYGERALAVGLGAVGRLWALCFHIGVCATWGIMFALLATLLRVDKTVWGPVVLGVCIGLAAQLVDINLITPPLMHTLHGVDLWAMTVPAWVSWVGHILFGLSFASFTPMFRRLWLRMVGREDLLWNDPRIK